MNAIARQFISTVIPHLDLHHEHCTVHQAAPGRIVCPDCRRLFCSECIVWDARDCKLACRECAHARHRRRRLGSLFRWLSKPLFHVILLAVLAVIIFQFGGGRQAQAPPAARPDDSRWFKNTAGVEQVLQARRARARASHLESHGHPEAAHPWYQLTASALTLAGECFGDFPGELDIAIGIQHARGKGGEVVPALVELLKMDTRVGGDDPRRLPYLFARAELHWLAGDQPSACDDWQKILEITAGQIAAARGDFLDSAVEMMAGGLHEAAIGKRLKEAADTAPAPELWRSRTLDALISRGIDQEALLRKTSPIPDFKLERF